MDDNTADLGVRIDRTADVDDEAAAIVFFFRERSQNKRSMSMSSNLTLLSFQILPYSTLSPTDLVSLDAGTMSMLGILYVV